MSEAPWRHDPTLAGQLHPQHPDDLQVIVHDGEPRRTRRAPEACWVTVQRVHGVLRSPVMLANAKPPLRAAAVTWVERTVYAGKLLNAPHQLTSVRQNDTLLLVYTPGLPHPLHVTDAYLAERSQWAFAPCDKCGTDQALDPPTVMARTRFPDTSEDEVPVMFSAFCPCQGTMMLAAIEDAPAAGGAATPVATPASKPWWKLW